MSLIKLSQYPKFSVPSNIREQIEKLPGSGLKTLSARELGSNESASELVCTIASGDKLLAFAELKIIEDCAYLQVLSVSTSQQNKGLGSILMMHGMRKLDSLGVANMRLECPQEMCSYFMRFGFIGLNDARAEQGSLMYQPSISYFLNHVPKARQLDGKLSGTLMQLGEDSQSYHFQTEQHYVALHRLMLNQAHKRIWLLADNINNPILNSEDTSQAICRLVKHNPHAEIKILLANDKQGAGYFNPCINMAQRLNSYIEIRSLQKTGVRMNEMITLVDYSASIYRKHIGDYNGFGCFHNRLLFERMRSNFDNHWQFAKPSMELRRLAI